MTLYLHIGTPKTGTTSIQHFMSDNAEALLEKGILVPSIFRNPNHTELYNYAVESSISDSTLKAHASAFAPKNLTAFTHSFIESISNHSGDTVVSCEYLSAFLIDFQNIKALANLCYKAADEVKVIIYLREQVESFISYYPTQILGGRRMPFSLKCPDNGTSWTDYYTELIECESKTGNTNPYREYPPLWLDYNTLVTRWASVFGKNNIDVRIFSKNTNIVNDFCDVIGFRSHENLIINAKRLNHARGYAETEIIRRLNYLFPRSIGTVGTVTTPERRGIFGKLKIAFLETGSTPSATISDYLDEAEIIKIREYFKYANKLISEDFFENKDLFTDSEQSTTTLDSKAIADYITEVFGVLWHLGQADVKKSQEQTQRYKSSNEKLKLQVIKLKDANLELKSQIVKHKDSNAALKSHIVKYKDSNAELKSQIVKHKDNSADLKSQIIKHKESHAELKSQIIQHKDSNAELKSQIIKQT